MANMVPNAALTSTAVSMVLLVNREFETISPEFETLVMQDLLDNY